MASRVTPHVPGGARIMITDGGAHPPEFWAQVTAEHIAPISPDLTGHRRDAALRLQLEIQKALEPHHHKVQHHEKGKLAADPDHLMTDVDPEPHLEEAMADILAAAKGTEWEGHFAKPEVLAAIRQEVGAHFATAQHIERSWHVDRNPKHKHAQAWRKRHHPGEEA